jgi:hypothetical protein
MIEWSWVRGNRDNKFILGTIAIIIALLILTPTLATPRYHPPETCTDMFPPKDSSQVVIEQRYYFEGCDFGNKSVLYCPRPLYEKEYLCVQKCVECHDDPWTCTKWETEGCDPGAGFDILSEPCGLDYNSGDWIFGEWVPLDTTLWTCPNARKLAELYEPQPTGLSFNHLSIGGKNSNSILRSKESTSMQFSAYIPACLNRIPVLRLSVNFIDGDLNSAARLYGIYSKHRTLDYLNENRGMIEGFIVPEQSAFWETYNLEADLDGYMSWAWRRQLVEAIGMTVNNSRISSSAWRVLPGEIPSTAGKVGDLYFSEDFVGGIHLSGHQSVDCFDTIKVDRICSLNLLTLGDVGKSPICKAKDLQNYYKNNGLTPELEGKIRSGCGISDTVDIEALDIKDSSAEITLSGMPLNVEFDTLSVFGMNYAEFSDYALNSSNHWAVYEKLREVDIISEKDLEDIIKSYLAGLFGPSKCLNQPFDYSISDAGVDFVSNLEGNIANTSLRLDIKLKEDFLAEITLSTSFEYNCTQSWTWGSMAELAPEYLAECLYNWEECLGILRQGGFYEVASAGYGPMEATPTLENNTEEILLDGGLMRESRERTVTVYRSCRLDEAWVAPQKTGDFALLYACPFDAWIARGGFSDELQYIGKKEVSDCYPYDDGEGLQHMVLKCDRAPSADERCFVEKADLGSQVYIGLSDRGDKMYYVCTPEGWVPWRKGDPEDKEEDEPPLDEDFGDEMFSVKPSMVNKGLGIAGSDIWHLNIKNEELYDLPIDLYMYSVNYPEAIGWVDFRNQSDSCGEGCKKTQLVLPKTGEFDPYSAVYTSVRLEQADRLGNYEFRFVVRESGRDATMHSKSAWLNVSSDAVGSVNLPLLIAFYGILVALIIRLEGSRRS